MPIEQGDAVPPTTSKAMTPDGIKDVGLKSLLAGKKVRLFGLPGAYTPVCTAAHLPEYIAEAGKLKAQGIAEITCIGISAFGLGERSQRYSMVVQDGVVSTINVEKSIFEHGSSTASSLLASAAE
jgi:glutaredoxin/glutathione-dependent peroxiredoxin